MKRLVDLGFIALVVSFVAGCATIDYDYPRKESFFLPETSDTYFGKLVGPDE